MNKLYLLCINYHVYNYYYKCKKMLPSQKILLYYKLIHYILIVKLLIHLHQYKTNNGQDM